MRAWPWTQPGQARREEAVGHQVVQDLHPGIPAAAGNAVEPRWNGIHGEPDRLTGNEVELARKGEHEDPRGYLVIRSDARLSQFFRARHLHPPNIHKESLAASPTKVICSPHDVG